MIMRDIDDSTEQNRSFITGIAGRKGYTVVTLSKTGMSSTPGVLRRILEIFEKANVNVEYVPSGIDSLSLVVSSASVADCLYSLLGELERSIKPDHIKTESDLAVVAAVGRRMAFRPVRNFSTHTAEQPWPSAPAYRAKYSRHWAKTA